MVTRLRRNSKSGPPSPPKSPSARPPAILSDRLLLSAEYKRRERLRLRRKEGLNIVAVFGDQDSDFDDQGTSSCATSLGGVHSTAGVDTVGIAVKIPNFLYIVY